MAAEGEMGYGKEVEERGHRGKNAEGHSAEKLRNLYRDFFDIVLMPVC